MQFNIYSGNLRNVNFNFGNCFKLEFDRVLENQKKCICSYFVFPSLPASFFLFLFSFYSYFVSLWQKSEMNSVKGAWFIWLGFRGFHLKKPGKIQKVVALGTCWEVAYVLAAETEEKGRSLCQRGWCQLFWCTLMMTHWLQNNPHLHRFLLAPALSSILNPTGK